MRSVKVLRLITKMVIIVNKKHLRLVNLLIVLHKIEIHISQFLETGILFACRAAKSVPEDVFSTHLSSSLNLLLSG